MGARLDNASLLHAAGVRIAISVSAFHRTYNAGGGARLGAGLAVANGLPWIEGLRALTSGPAAIFGMSRPLRVRATGHRRGPRHLGWRSARARARHRADLGARRRGRARGPAPARAGASLLAVTASKCHRRTVEERACSRSRTTRPRSSARAGRRARVAAILPAARWSAAARAGAAEAGASATGGLPLEPTRTVAFETDQGTWLSVDVAPDGRTLVFDLLGDLYLLDARAARHSGITSRHRLRFATGLVAGRRAACFPERPLGRRESLGHARRRVRAAAGDATTTDPTNSFRRPGRGTAVHCTSRSTAPIETRSNSGATTWRTGARDTARRDGATRTAARGETRGERARRARRRRMVAMSTTRSVPVRSSRTTCVCRSGPSIAATSHRGASTRS